VGSLYLFVLTHDPKSPAIFGNKHSATAGVRHRAAEFGALNFRKVWTRHAD
jgi:hypothetical protein